MVERDRNDSTRALAPCVPAPDSVLLDNSNLDLEGTKDAILKIVKKKSKNLYMRIHSWLAPLVRFFQRIKVSGLDSVDTNKGYILCANHIAARDVLLIAAAYPSQIRFIAKKELFSVPIIGKLIRKLGAIELDRQGNDVAAIKTSVNVAKSGLNIAIFPQGHRYPKKDPNTTPTKNGAALIAYKSESDILPVFIKTKGNKYAFLRKKEIIFGKPIKNSELGFISGGRDEYKVATDKIFSEILKLGGYKALPAPSEKESKD